MTKCTAADWLIVPSVVAGLAVSGAAVATADGAAHAARASKVSVRADPSGNLAFTKAKLKAKHGKVKITMSDPSSSGIPHGIAVQGNGVKKVGEIVAPGSKSKLTVRLKPGRYTFYCPVPGHRAAGMHGRLVVK